MQLLAVKPSTMPTYLIHGFRWQRQAIRIHVAFYNLDDAAPDWLMAPTSALAMHESFYKICDFLPPNEPPAISTPRSTSKNVSPSRAREGEAQPKSFIKRMTSRASLSTMGRKQRPPSRDNEIHRKDHSEGATTAESSNGGQLPYPDEHTTGIQPTNVAKTTRFNEWSAIKLLEQYDLNEQIHPYQEYAYVGDYVIEVKLGASISEHTQKYQEWLSRVKEGAWIEKLRDKLQADADIGWYVVVCGDEDRFAPEPTDVSTYEEGRGDYERKDLKTGGLKSYFGKKSVDSRRGIPDEETPELAKDDRISRAESQLQHERKKASRKSPTVSSTAS